nr:hypothetical protein KPHV_47110 [Kitasatospora purpeofusca]
MNKNDLDPAWLAHRLGGAEWLTASSGGTNCVEVAFLDRGIVAIRDSVNPKRHPLLLTDAGFAVFANGIRSGLLQRPAQIGADPVTAITKNDLDPHWLAGQLAQATWKFAGPGNVGVAFLPRAVTAFCGAGSNSEPLVLIFADSEITDFSEGIRSGRFQRREGSARQTRRRSYGHPDREASSVVAHARRTGRAVSQVRL